ncbi:c2 domain containing protein [Chrysochromulina tobinii]|uniref:C2 domain containing protein n=1 Tax=Chrysochromulina tobinii TaxID=1460289 RepID=A0A0M0JD70_9EUKA|nr:c2 domain containing protein [Chrysochromulina tobinii]|eukprot:KOO24435.1 c2 domain containing protein [Chrysochromulina sp. CCMP291]
MSPKARDRSRSPLSIFGRTKRTVTSPSDGREALLSSGAGSINEASIADACGPTTTPPLLAASSVLPTGPSPSSSQAPALAAELPPSKPRGRQRPPVLPRKATAPGQLLIGVRSAKDLAAVNSSGRTSDPYVKVTVYTPSQVLEKKTTPRMRTLAPEWEEELSFGNVYGDGELPMVELAVYDAEPSFDKRFAVRQLRLHDYAQLTAGEVLELPSLELNGTNARRHGKLSAGTFSTGPIIDGQGTLHVWLAWLPGAEPIAPRRSGWSLSAAVGLSSGTSGVRSSGELEHYAEPDDEMRSEKEKSAREALAKETAEAAQAQVEEEEAALAAIKPGDYQLHVHVIEARELAGRDWNGTSDPYVTVRWLDQSRSTTVRNAVTSPIWDEHLFVQHLDLEKSQVHQSHIEVSVYDEDEVAGIKTSELIGQFFLDASTLYYRKDHELYRQWLVLSAPYEARKKLVGQAAAGGQAGYLKLSLTLSGPGDTPPNHDEEAEDEEGESVPLMPASMKQELLFVRVAIHSAYGLPKVDSSTLDKLYDKRASIDPYVQVRLGGEKLRTKVIKTNTMPVWHVEFWMPLLMPTVDTKLKLKLKDYNFGQSHRTLQEWTVALDPVLRAEPGAQLLTWLHLYGPSEAAKRRDNNKLRRFEYHSEWHGRLLIALRVERPDKYGQYAIGGKEGGPNKEGGSRARGPLPERPLMRLMSSEAERRRPAECLYQARFAVLCGTGIDPKEVQTSVELQLGEFEFGLNTKGARAAVREGQATFQSEMGALDNERAPGVLRPKGKQHHLRLPLDTAQLPDAILYVLRGGKRAYYARFKARTLVDAQFAPRWVHLAPCASSGNLVRTPKGGGAAASPPALLVSLGLARINPGAMLQSPPATPRSPPDEHSTAPAAASSAASSAASGAASGAAEAVADEPPPVGNIDWLPTLEEMPARQPLTAYELRVHAYMARDLPARDENGALDPYLVASLAGIEARAVPIGHSGTERAASAPLRSQTQTLPATAFPSWFETLTLPLWLPPLTPLGPVPATAPSIGAEHLDKEKESRAHDDAHVAPPRSQSLKDLLQNVEKVSNVVGGAVGNVLETGVSLGARIGAGIGVGLGLGGAPKEGEAPVEEEQPTPMSTKERAKQAQQKLEALLAEGRPLLAPEVILSVWDSDEGTLTSEPDEFVGRVCVPLRAAHIVPCEDRALSPEIEPFWISLAELDHEGLDGGEIMIRLELVELDLPSLASSTSRDGASRDVMVHQVGTTWQIADDVHEPERPAPLLRQPSGAPAHPVVTYRLMPIMPEFEWHTVTVVVLSLQGLRSSTLKLPRWLSKNAFIESPSKPFVELDAGKQPHFVKARSQDKAIKKTKRLQSLRQKVKEAALTLHGVKDGAVSVRRTRSSDQPSPLAPVFFEVLKLRLKLPTNHLFMPTVNVRVYDTQFGGLYTPMLGYTGIDLRDYMSGSEVRAACLDELKLGEELGELERSARGGRWGSEASVATPGGAGTECILMGAGLDECNGLYRHVPEGARSAELEARANGKDLFRNANGAEIYWSDTNWTRGKGYPAGVGCWGIALDGHHRYLARGDSPRPPETGWVVRVGLGVAPAPTLRRSAAAASMAPLTLSELEDQRLEKKLVDELRQLIYRKVQILNAQGRSHASIADALLQDMLVVERLRLPTTGPVDENDVPLATIEWVQRILLQGQELPPMLNKLHAPGKLYRILCQCGLKTTNVGWIALQRATKLAKEERRLASSICKVEHDLLAAIDRSPGLITALRGRDTLNCKLEESSKHMGPLPFDVFVVKFGQRNHQRKVCTMKCVVHLGESEDEEEERLLEQSAADEGAPRESQHSAQYSAAERLFEALQKPMTYIVRVYVLIAKDLPENGADKPDPYLRLSLGEQAFEFTATLPGATVLCVDVMDKNFLWEDVLIGGTEIDIEDRIFSKHWQAVCSARPPKERRELRRPEINLRQGFVDLFVEIMTENEALHRRMLDISPPPTQKWEMRLIIWSARDVPRDLDDSGLSDLYVAAQYDDPYSKKKARGMVLRTDTHFRASKGKASWNWRMRFPVELRYTDRSLSRDKRHMLRLKLWDWDVSLNDLAGETSLDLSEWFERVYKRQSSLANHGSTLDELEKPKGDYKKTADERKTEDERKTADDSHRHGEMHVPPPPLSRGPSFLSRSARCVTGAGGGSSSTVTDGVSGAVQLSERTGSGAASGARQLMPPLPARSSPSTGTPSPSKGARPRQHSHLSEAPPATAPKKGAGPSEAKAVEPLDPSLAGAVSGEDRLATFWEPLLGAPRGSLNYETSLDSAGRRTYTNRVEYEPDPREELAPGQLEQRSWLSCFGKRPAVRSLGSTKPLVEMFTGGKYDTFTDAADSVLAGDAFGADEDEDEMQPHKFWVQLSGEKEVAVPGRPDKVRWKRPAGQLLISVQLVPAAEAKLYPAGNGRSAPNQHPKLPRPVGRLRFTLNPFALVHQFLGDKLCAYLVCALALLACVLIAYYMIPAVLANLFTTVLFEKLFSQTGIIILGSVGVVLILLLLCVCGRR